MHVTGFIKLRGGHLMAGVVPHAGRDDWGRVADERSEIGDGKRHLVVKRRDERADAEG